MTERMAVAIPWNATTPNLANKDLRLKNVTSASRLLRLRPLPLIIPVRSLISLFRQCLFAPDDEDDDDDEDGDSGTTHLNNHPTGKNTTNKRDDSRRRAAHTAAEQKRRNAIRVTFILAHRNHSSLCFSRKVMTLCNASCRTVICSIRSVHRKWAKQRYSSDVSVERSARTWRRRFAFV